MSTTTAPTYWWGTGRRKTAVARVRLCPGTGKIEINGRSLENYFTELRDRKLVTLPLEIAEQVGKLDVYVNVSGGGFAGQAGAICHGVARALKELFSGQAPPDAASPSAPSVHPIVHKLREAGLLTRDARRKERKKYGRRGARRGFQFSKR
ncbi:MAG: 30S ribosomal protein S9 [Gemmatales bacterium]|nr:30S ribosomal protein S9 [Gemmatales bacterium]MCS7161493.1 30S ribosomal protein S9 [Gemmatales bacterium]MDW8176696.1 30S ribosomal protein S9 [Gemmatales bacterium]MDW8223739.1 30S ribosomal protein S9 [Gemmatales bacterium]